MKECVKVLVRIAQEFALVKRNIEWCLARLLLSCSFLSRLPVVLSARLYLSHGRIAISCRNCRKIGFWTVAMQEDQTTTPEDGALHQTGA
jgi:hypothetical protein